MHCTHVIFELILCCIENWEITTTNFYVRRSVCEHWVQYIYFKWRCVPLMRKDWDCFRSIYYIFRKMVHDVRRRAINCDLSLF